MKETYEAPRVDYAGSLAELTAGAIQPRNQLDGAKPVGKSLNQPIYS